MSESTQADKLWGVYSQCPLCEVGVVPRDATIRLQKLRKLLENSDDEKLNGYSLALVDEALRIINKK